MKVAVPARWNQYRGTPSRVDCHDGERRRRRHRFRQRELDAVLGKLSGEQRAERVGGEPAEEPGRVAEPGDGPGGS